MITSKDIECCPVCGSKDLEATSIHVEQKVDRLTMTGKVCGQKCLSCGERVAAAEEHRLFDMKVSAHLVKQNLKSPAAFRFIRQSLGLLGKDVATLMAVSAETVSRWEQGRRSFDETTWRYLCTLFTNHQRAQPLITEALRLAQEMGEADPVDTRTSMELDLDQAC